MGRDDETIDTTVPPDFPPETKGHSLVVAYTLWAVLGVFGAHHLYLGRHSQAVLYLQTFGFFGVGWIRDMFMLPRYVDEANCTSGYNSVLKAKWHATKGKPYSNFERLAAQQIAAFWYCWMASNIVDQESHTSLARVLGGVGAAFGAWLVGVIGSETTSLKKVAVPTVITAIATGFMPIVVCVAVVSAYLSRRMQHAGHKKKLAGGSTGGALAILIIVQILFLVIFVVALSRSGTVKVKTGADGFDSEDAGESAGGDTGGSDWQRTWESFNFRDFWNELVEKMQAHEDPYTVLGVSRSDSWGDIKRAYRELAVKYHPDKNPDNPEEAAQQFMRISKAYQQLTKEHKEEQRRARRSEATPDHASASSSTDSTSGSASGSDSSSSGSSSSSTGGGQASGSDRASSKRSRKARSKKSKRRRRSGSTRDSEL